MTTEPSIGVVIPAYAPEIRALEGFIEDIRQLLDPETVRVEFDAPQPDHVERVDAVADVVNVSTDRRGKGAAIMEGFDRMDEEVIAFADADGSVPASSLADIVAQIDEGAADVGIGSRRHPTSEIITHQTVARRALGDAFAFAARKMLPTKCRDYQCGAKAVHRAAWKAIGHHCYEPGFAWDLEFVSVAGALGYEIAEVPVEWADHPDSTVDPVSTSIELATALLDVKRRTTAISRSPRFRDTSTTDRATLTRPSDDET